LIKVPVFLLVLLDQVLITCFR